MEEMFSYECSHLKYFLDMWLRAVNVCELPVQPGNILTEMSYFTNDYMFTSGSEKDVGDQETF